ncbi:helix-turn-helix domain-containing protein [Croceivirga thetidis]|uniref:Helix-turn-helix domain-containing protein n=1 Tax=Croceivirga thetidis TaxID=2721623 RepID=A0ABX1GKI2_9FLAO|nr:helix-turn-helix domain-containing protein [Croceivirga thetidis]NKI30413.1 helix-turn-helix domain-containing protein [Croceivirga thetidis]
MDAVKTYRNINRSDANASFGISRMEDIFENRKGAPDAPHRHDFYTVLFVKSAKGQHRIDFNSYALDKNQVYFISPGQVHQLIEDEQSIGYSLVFSEEFLVLNQISVSFIEDINLFQDSGANPPLSVDDTSSQALATLTEQMLIQFSSSHKYKFEALGALLKLFLIQCHSLCSLNELDVQTQETGANLVRNFKKLVHTKYKEWHHANSYAEALHITPDHLNRVIKSLTGKTTKEHLQSRITTAAKRLLYFSELSNKEIAFELGFSEPANFSAFFKKCTGISPSAFREEPNIGFS